MQRAIQAKKFYATLPHKLEQAEEEWHKQQPEDASPWETTEKGSFGEPGWFIQATFKPRHKDDD